MPSNSTNPTRDAASPRWVAAQERESAVWRRLGRAQPDYLARRGAFLDAWLAFWDAGGERVLEIGGAGMPVLDYLTGFTERYAVDPLMKEYERLFGARGEPARAEALPFPDGHFDAVVLLNVLDHVDEPDRALREVARVLHPTRGKLFLSCDTYARTWLRLRGLRIALRGKRNNDWLHPHHFTVASLVRRVAREFEILESSERFSDPLLGARARRTAYPAGGWRARLKREGRVYIVARPKV